MAQNQQIKTKSEIEKQVPIETTKQKRFFTIVVTKFV